MHSKEIRKCCSKKHILWKKIQASPYDLSLRSKYRECLSRWRELIHQGVELAERRLVASCDLGAFYRHVNKRITSRSTVGAIVMDSGQVLVSDVDKANAFNKYFSSVGVTDNNIIPCCDAAPMSDSLESIKITGTDVLIAIRKLKRKLSCGPDGLPPILFKELASSLSEPLALLFNQLLSVGEVPDDWLKAIIIPVFKKGTSGTLSNYRPISLTSVSSKIMERIVSNKIYNFLTVHGVLSHAQHGFVKGRSVCTNMLESLNDWTINIQARDQTTVVYIDFRKAFDVVTHNKLFAKLQSYNITGSVLLWLQRFFSGRTHQTKLGDSLSDVLFLLSGVIQGSAIGPLMFLIFINELISLLEQHGINVKLFADDVKLYLRIVNDADIAKLQSALSSLASWAESWQLSISVDKCCVLNIGNIVIEPLLNICGKSLPALSSTVTSVLSFLMTCHLPLIFLL